MPNNSSILSRVLRFIPFGEIFRRPPPPLIDRGFGLIYDTERDITWLQDVNYAQTVRHSRDGQMTWPEAMARKTAIKRAAKLLPKSTKDNRFAMAVEMDSLAEAGKLRIDRTTGEIIEGEAVGPSQETVDAIDNASNAARTVGWRWAVG